MNVKYYAPFLDPSGYAQAARNAIVALDKVGVGLTTELISFSKKNKGGGVGYKIAMENLNKEKDYKIKIIQLTPNFFDQHREEGKYNIGFMFWEVVGVDPRWVKSCNTMDEIWTSSEAHANVLKTFGVKVPIKFIPVPLDPMYEDIKYLPRQRQETRFYSIFQWTERKNPEALIKAYWKAFEGVKDVQLILKVYGANFGRQEQIWIKTDVYRFRLEQEQETYPKLGLQLEEMSPTEVMRVHFDNDIFVSAHRGEGWGMPHMEAMAFGNPIISTNWGGIHGLLNKENAWLVPFNYVNVRGMNHIEWYNKEQLWADVQIDKLMEAMREAHYNKQLTAMKGNMAYDLIHKELSSKKIGQMMKERLEEIEKSL